MNPNPLNEISTKEAAGLAALAFAGIGLFLAVIQHLWSISF
jgi:hypothetical protein